jgi:predicted metal-dependent hydrolase
MVYDLHYKQLAADTLAKVRAKLMKITSILQKKYPSDPRIHRLTKKFNPDNIVETEPNSKFTSYSINKGEKIVLCLRSRDGQHRMVKENVLVFVALHELAHIMTQSVGHTQEFWNNFEFLLKEATQYGVYEDIDFNNDSHDYCGIKITDSPLRRNRK